MLLFIFLLKHLLRIDNVIFTIFSQRATIINTNETRVLVETTMLEVFDFKHVMICISFFLSADENSLKRMTFSLC